MDEYVEAVDFRPRSGWRWVLVRAIFGCAGIVFLYAAFLHHRELYVPSLQAAGVLTLAIAGAVLFHEAIR